MFFAYFNRKLIGGFAIGAACICLVASAIWCLYFHRILTSSIRVQGKVIQVVDRREQDGTVYYPVFIFRDINGLEHTVYSNVGSYPPSYKVGDKITVLYRAGAADDAQIEDFFFIWGVPLIIGILGIIYLPFGLIMWFWPTFKEWLKSGK